MVSNYKPSGTVCIRIGEGASVLLWTCTDETASGTRAQGDSSFNYLNSIIVYKLTIFRISFPADSII